MSADNLGQAGDVVVDPLLAEQRMVEDPRISADQAAPILNLEIAQVHRLMSLGRLPTHGRPGSARRLLLSEVVRLRDLEEPIALGEAARVLHCTIAEVRELLAAGQLTSQPTALRPVYRTQVEDLARTQELPPPRSRPGEEPTGYVGRPPPRGSSAGASAGSVSWPPTNSCLP
jgi:hypothetical protein